MAEYEQNAEIVARKCFVMTAVGAVLYVGTVILFIL